MRLLDTIGRFVVRIWTEIRASGIWTQTPATPDSPDRQPDPDDLFYIALLGPHI
jgi:hypothetical protein